MTYRITAPQQLETEINLPASKSISNRALIIYALSGRKTMPEHLSDCDDTVVMVNALRDMPETIDIKAGGTAMRFLTAYLAVTPGEHTITGTERMRHRPINILADALRRLGADVAYEENEGFPPLRIKGRQLQGGSLEVQGDVSSQFISALLMIAPGMEKGLTLHLTGDIISRPYIDLTLCTMRNFGADAEWTDNDTIEVKPQPYTPQDYYIESDGSLQGDSVVKYLFSMLGIKTSFSSRTRNVPTTVTLRKTGLVSARLDYNFINQPDLAQTFVVTCALMGVPFHFTGLATLHIKETDRIVALKTEMRKLGYVISDGDGTELIWDGERCEPEENPVIDTYEDQRMALAFAPAASQIPGLGINNPQVVTKSYPHFWKDLADAGFLISEE